MLRRILAESKYLPKATFKAQIRVTLWDLNTNRWTIMGKHLGKCYIAYRYHITTQRNTFFEVVHFTPKPLPEVKPKLQKILSSYQYCNLMVMTIYLSCIDRYLVSLNPDKILGFVTAFVNEGQTSTVKFQEGFWAACIKIFFCIFRTQSDTANYDFLKA